MIMKKNSFFGKLIDRSTLAVYSLFSGRLKKEMIDEQYAVNKEAWKEYLAQNKITGERDVLSNSDASGEYGVGNGFMLIEDQTKLTAFRYGTNKGQIGKKLFDGKKMTGADNTCEVIAVYNAMHFLASQGSHDGDATGGNVGTDSGNVGADGEKHSRKTLPGFPELLRTFSKKGIAYKGMFGTNPKALKNYLIRKGYKVEELKVSELKKGNCKRVEKEYKAYILTTFNEGHNPFSMVHTMCVTREDGANISDKVMKDMPQDKGDMIDHSSEGYVFQLHNDYEGSKTYPTLYDAITGYNNGKGNPITLLCISDE